jgi:hypothetical protein
MGSSNSSVYLSDEGNDVWKYDVTTGLWTWMAGSNTTKPLGVYGTKGTAASTNAPGGRYASANWTDVSGNFWLLGGKVYTTTSGGYDDILNDLWKFSPAIPGLWTGAVSTDFSNPANWNDGNIPTTSTNVTITSTATRQPTLTANATCNSITIGSGATLSFGANTLNVYGNITNSGSISAAAGTIALLGSSTAQTITGAITVNNLVMNNGFGVALNDSMYVKTGFTPTSGTLFTNGKLVLLSDANQTAYISAGTGVYLNGIIGVQQYIPGGYRRYRFLSNPFGGGLLLNSLINDIDITGVGGSMNGFTNTTSNSPSAFIFNTSNSNGNATNDAGWAAIASTTSVSWGSSQGLNILIRGSKGQINSLNGTPAGNGTGGTYLPNAVTLHMYGTVNTGAVGINLFSGGTGATATQGFNLIGNPYPSPVDIGTVVSNNSNVSQTVYTRNPVTSSYTTKAITGAYIIPENTTFFIRALSNTTLNFAESNKATCSTCPTVFGNEITNYLQLKVMAEGEEWDNWYVFFNDKNKAAFEPLKDASKLSNDYFNIYSLSSDNEKLAVDYRNVAGLETHIPLGIAVAQSVGIKTYQLMFDEYTIDKEHELYLHDKLKNTYTLLTKGGSIELNVNTADATTYGNNRLELINKLKVSNALAEITPKFTATLKSSLISNQLQVNIFSPTINPTSVKIVNVTGQVLAVKNLGNVDNAETVFPTNNLTNGIYFVEVMSGSEKLVLKAIKN